MPRSYALYPQRQTVTSSPLNQLAFNPSNIAATAPDVMALPTPLQLFETMLNDMNTWIASVESDVPQLIETIINTLLGWIGDSTGLNFVELLTEFGDQNTAVNTFLNALFSGASTSTINTDWAAVLTAFNYSGDTATLTSIWDWIGNMIAASNDYLTALYKAGSQLLDDVVAGANSTTLNADWTALMVALGLEPAGGFESIWNSLIDAGWGTVTTTQVLGVTDTVYPGSVGRGTLSATARATKFVQVPSWSGHGILVGVVTTVIPGMPREAESGYIFGHGVLTATAKATQFRGTSSLSGRGVLSVYVTTAVFGPRFSEAGSLTGRGVLSGSATANEFRETDFLSGRGVLSAQATTIFGTGTVIAGTAYELGVFHGVGSFTGVVKASKFTGLTGATSGHGLLTTYVTTVIPGMPRFAETCALHGSGVLTATAKATQFRETDALSGRGVLTAAATTIYGTGGIASELGAVTGRGVLTAAGRSSKFSGLTGTLSGHGVLSPYVTTVVPGMPREAENGYVTGRGVLTAAATANQFRETDLLSGHGVLTAQATTIYSGSTSSVNVAYELGAGHGVGALTGVAHATKFTGLTGATVGHGLQAPYVTTVIPGMPRFAETVPATGQGKLSAAAFGNEFRETPALVGRGVLSAYVTTMVAGIKQAIAAPVSGRGVLSATAKTTKAVVTASLSGHGGMSFTSGGQGPSIGSFDQALLNALEDALTGNLTGTVAQLQAAFNDLMALLGSPTALGTGSPVPSGPASTPLLGTLVPATNSTVANDIFNGGSFWPSLMALLFPNNSGSVGSAVASAAVTGLLGPTDIGSSLQASVDSLWNALTNPTTYQSGNSLQSLASAAQNLWNTLFNPGAVVDTTTANSATLSAQAVGNVPATAIDSSANAVFPISQISGSSPTTIAVDSADSAIGYILVPTAGTKETVIWLGQTIGTLSSFVINLYQVDTTTGALNYLFSSPDLHGSLSGTLGWNYWNVSNSVSVDNVASGNSTGTTSGNLLTWVHTIGTNANIILVNISVNSPSSPFDYQGYPNFSVSCAGISMTLLQAVNCNNGTTSGWNAVYYLKSPPPGTQTMEMYTTTIGMGGAPNLYMSGNSVSYIGVASLGTPVVNTGSSTTPTTGAVTSASGNMVFAGFSGVRNTRFTAPSGTSRYNFPGSTNANEQANLIQDAAGASSVTLSATLSSAAAWSAIGVNLIASNALAAAQNDVYAVEMTLQGSGYYNMVGIPNHWLPVNTNVFPQSLGATQDSYNSPVWDSNGAGAAGGSAIAGLTWSHTNAANAYLVVAVIEYCLGGSPTHTATYNGVSMTNLGSQSTGSFLKLTLFGLAVTASGTHTVSVSSTQNGYMTGRSTSFTGVTSAGSSTASSGSSSTVGFNAAAPITGAVLFEAIGSLNTAITITQGNNSWTETNTNAELAGAWSSTTQNGSSGSFGGVFGTMSSAAWIGVAVPLLGAAATPSSGAAPAYSADVPWIGIGGTAGITQQTPATTEMATWYGNVNPTTGAYTYTIPSWVISDHNNGQNDLIDIIMVGAGGAGGGGTSSGGSAGAWTVATLTYGTQITSGTTTITGIAGLGGTGGAGGSSPGTGTAGANTTAIVAGYGTLTAAGGTADSSGAGFFGASPGVQVWNGTNYYGGAEETNINYGGFVGYGNNPGGGGSAGGTLNANNYSGGNGAAGVVWFVARQPG